MIPSAAGVVAFAGPRGTIHIDLLEEMTHVWIPRVWATGIDGRYFLFNRDAARWKLPDQGDQPTGHAHPHRPLRKRIRGLELDRCSVGAELKRVLALLFS